jgi:phosphoribosylaminoimidazolecarboxamide formyltransferase/IMP cyclohydrolase
VGLNRVEKIDGPVMIRRVLMSVYDKTGIEDLAEYLVDSQDEIDIYSTGGTYRLLAANPKIAQRLHQVSDYTGQPEMQGGLVKTLDFKIYLGLLSETYNPDHQRDLQRTGAVPIDLVVVNLYPFGEATSDAGSNLEDGRTNIDIGGPCMLRAAAKNFHRVAAVCNPLDYPGLKEELSRGHGSTGVEYRLNLARRVFAATAEYDGAIATFLAGRSDDELARIYDLTGG